MTEKEFKKITELLDDKITLYQAIGEPFGKDLDIAIKLSVAYEKLQQENKKLNGAIQTYDILLKSNVEENKKLKEALANNGIVSTCENCETFGICPHSYREYDYKYECDKLKREMNKVAIQQK